MTYREINLCFDPGTMFSEAAEAAYECHLEEGCKVSFSFNGARVTIEEKRPHPFPGETIKEKFDEVGVRPEVLRFAVAMENTLRLHDDKGGWSKCSSKYLLSRMKDEIHELENALAFPGIPAPIRNEAVDVANFAMMLYDIFHWRQRKMEAPSPEYCEGCDHWVGGACTSPDQDCHPETHEPSDDIPLERNDA